MTVDEPVAISAEQRAAELGSRLDLLLAVGHADEACVIVADAFAARTGARDIPELVAVVSAPPDRNSTPPAVPVKVETVPGSVMIVPLLSSSGCCRSRR